MTFSDSHSYTYIFILQNVDAALDPVIDPHSEQSEKVSTVRQ